jgi:hypothetical protein
MRDDPVGDIDRKIVGCIACTGSRDEHKIPRAVVCRVRLAAVASTRKELAIAQRATFFMDGLLL